MKKRKVAILQNGLTYGGTDTFVVNLCRGLDKEQFDITVINPCPREISPREREVEAAGIRIVHTTPIKGGNISSLLRHLRLLYKELRRGRYDVFHTNIDLMNGPQLLVAWLAGVPMRICHSHNSQRSSQSIGQEGIYEKVTRWMCWHFSNRRCGCSRQAMDFLYSGHKWEQNSYPWFIPNGIGFDIITEPKPNRKIKQIVAVGRLCGQKNPLFLLEIFYNLSQIRNDVNLLCVGDGPLRESMEDFVRSKNLTSKVFMPGWKKNIPDILLESDVFLMPSLFEGLPFALIEAQGSGLPCLVSDNIDNAALCGLAEPMSIKVPAKEWAQRLSEILDGKHQLRLDLKKFAPFTVTEMARQFTKLTDSRTKDSYSKWPSACR